MMTKLLITLLGAGVLAVGGYAASSGLDSDPTRTVSLPGASIEETTTATTTVGDVSGPCDEAENRNDARCAGAAVPAPAPVTTVGTTAVDGVDVPGPCDEAENRNDARCTGGVAADDGNSGPGGGDHRSGRAGDDDRDGHGGDGDDRSGSNSGKD